MHVQEDIICQDLIRQERNVNVRTRKIKGAASIAAALAITTGTIPAQAFASVEPDAAVIELISKDPGVEGRLASTLSTPMSTRSAFDSTAMHAMTLAAQAEESSVASVTTAGGETTYFDTMNDAVAALANGDTLDLLADVDLPSTFEIACSVTINGNGHTITTHDRGLYLTGGETADDTHDFVLNGVTITNSDPAGRCINLREGYKSLVANNCSLTTTGTGNNQPFTIGSNTPQTADVTFSKCTIDAGPSGYAIITFNPTNMTIDGTDVTGYAALYIKGPLDSAGSHGSVFTIKGGSTLTGLGKPGATNSFGTIVLEEKDVTVNVEDATIKAVGSDGKSAQNAILLSQYAEVTGATLTFSKDSVIVASDPGTYILTSSNSHNANNTLSITGGTFETGQEMFGPAANADGIDITVTGGSFSTPDVAQYVPIGTAVMDTETGDAPFILGDADDFAGVAAGYIVKDGVRVYYKSTEALADAAKAEGTAAIPTTRKVVFVDRFGDPLKEVEVNFGEGVDKDDIPQLPEDQLTYEEDGVTYNFTGWEPDPFSGFEEDTEIAPSYSSEEEQTFILTFVNGLTGDVIGAVEAAEGDVLADEVIPQAPATMEVDGVEYEFKGWDPDPAGYEVTEDATFTAQYEEKKPAADDEGSESEPAGDDSEPTDDGTGEEAAEEATGAEDEAGPVNHIDPEKIAQMGDDNMPLILGGAALLSLSAMAALYIRRKLFY